MVITFQKTFKGELDYLFSYNDDIREELKDLSNFPVSDNFIYIDPFLEDKNSLFNFFSDLLNKLFKGNSSYESIKTSNSCFFFKGNNSGILKFNFNENIIFNDRNRKPNLAFNKTIRGYNLWLQKKNVNVRVYKRLPPNIELTGKICFEKLNEEPVDLIKGLVSLGFNVNFKSTFEVLEELKVKDKLTSYTMSDNSSSNDYSYGMLSGALLYSILDN